LRSKGLPSRQKGKPDRSGVIWLETRKKREKVNIYVGNLPFSASEDDVRQVFEAYGEVRSVTLIKDRETGRMRGFGFVEMPDDGHAQDAIQALNGKDFIGRALVVNQARPREERGGGGFSRERRSGGYGGGRQGGYGGGDRRRKDGGGRRNDW
jgi:RNA recognition motif-containing protein